MKGKNTSIEIYDFLRTFAMLLVVLGHGPILQFGNAIYTMQENRMMTIFLGIQKILYTFHVPLFFWVSGAVYHLCRSDYHKYQTAGELIRSKWKKLLIPYCAVFIFLMVPIRLCVGFYKDNVILSIIRDFLGFGDNGHLWFLLVLFEIFVLYYFLEWMARRSPVILTGMVILLYVVAFTIPDQYDTVLRYQLWFWMGYEFERRGLRRRLSSRYLLAKASAFLTVFFAAFWISQEQRGVAAIIVANILTFSGISLCYLLAMVAKRHRISLQWLSGYSFAIYLYHDLFNYLILAVFVGSGSLGNTGPAGYFVLMLLKSVGVIILSIGLSKMVQKLGMILRDKEEIVHGNRR